MSRNYATIATSIWRPDNDFGELSMPAQWAYFMLITQPDISAAGSLSLNVRRWAKRTRGGTRESVIAAIQELEAAEKVFYDYDTEELLIRKFVKWDGGYGNQKRRPVIERAALDMESERLRKVLADQLRELGDPAMALLADRLCAPYASFGPEVGGDAVVGPVVEPQQDSDPDLFSQGNSLSPIHGVVVTQGVVVVPQPSTHTPETQPAAGAQVAPPTKQAKPRPASTSNRGTRLAEDFQPSAASRKWAAGKDFKFDLDRETEKFCLHWWAESGSNATKLNWDRAWQKWMLGVRNVASTDLALPGNNGSGYTSNSRTLSTAAKRHHEGLALADELDRMQAEGNLR